MKRPITRRVDGIVALDLHDVGWTFIPATAWTAGAYNLVAQGFLEDPQGNQIGRAFEVVDRPAGQPTRVRRRRASAVTAGLHRRERAIAAGRSGASIKTFSLRPSEWPLVVYFIYIAVLGDWRSGSLLEPATFALAVPLAVAGVALGQAIDRRRGWAIVRDWLPVAFVLVAYWSVDWVALPHGDYEIENRIVRYDRRLLDSWGVRTAIEALGPLLPAILEAAYLGVYAVLPVTIAGFYARHERDRVDTFLLPFLVGTLAVYAVLPHYPSEAPRFVFDGIDVPPIHTRCAASTSGSSITGIFNRACCPTVTWRPGCRPRSRCESRSRNSRVSPGRCSA